MRGWLLILIVSPLPGCHAPASCGAKAQAAVPPPPPFCTRTLGVAECFADPAALPDHPSPLADGPSELTPQQQRDQAAWWRL